METGPKERKKRRINLIDGSISSYWYILNSPEQIYTIKKENRLASVIGDKESDHLWAKEDRKNIVMEAEYQRKNKSEQNHMRDNHERLKTIETCEVLV